MKYNLIFTIISVLFLLSPVEAFTQEKIEKLYELYGGRGAETNRIIIGDMNNKMPISYYLSYNACTPK